MTALCRFQPCPSCCTSPCRGCEDAPPASMQITIAGVTNAGGCSDCETVNDTWICDYDVCRYDPVYGDGDHYYSQFGGGYCGGVGIGIGVDVYWNATTGMRVITVEVWGGSIAECQWKLVETGQSERFTCADFASKVIPPYATMFGRCSVVGSTCLLTAL
jgi:hypothetical protein